MWIGAISAITLGDEPPHWPQTDGPAVSVAGLNGFGGHYDSLLYLVCTDWRVMPRRLRSAARPALFRADRRVRFDLFSQAMERQRGAKPNRRVIRREIRTQFLDVHGCQYRLTFLICPTQTDTSHSARSLLCFSRVQTSGSLQLVREPLRVLSSCGRRS